MTQKQHQIYGSDEKQIKDRPWIFRTYAGHTNVWASNALYRENLAKGQTGLSIALDLPTQCGYSSDHPIAAPEIGKVGVPINSLDDFRVLFDNIPLAQMNTSMTINGTAMWLMALYIALAEERGVDLAELKGTTQNDLIKEYLARGTYIFPPEDSMRLIVDMYEYCLHHVPAWNASNICSYHLQEAGATPVQELAFALVNAITILDAIRDRKCFSADEFERCVGRISFFVNSGMRFIEEMCKMRAFCEMWDEITRERYGIKNPKYRRFRYGVQVNSLGLTAEQPENNAWRILLETLGVTLSRKARCRALQLPAWNEALSLPRPWDQQWSLRIQQILAYETDLLEYPDLFDGSPVIASKVTELKQLAYTEIYKILDMGGGIAAVRSGYMKAALVSSQQDRLQRLADGDQIVVGKNRWTEGTRSPLLSDRDGGVFKVDASAAQKTVEALRQTRQKRDDQAVTHALAQLSEAASSGANLMLPSIACAKAGVTTGEWTETLRAVFGDYRPPTGVEGQNLISNGQRVESVRNKVDAFISSFGYRPKILVAKPGLDGHSNGAEMISVAARNAGFEVIYFGIRLTPEEIVQSAIEENVDVIGVSLLSGSHNEIMAEVFRLLSEQGANDQISVVLGGIIPDSDYEQLKSIGVQRIYSPKDYDPMAVMEDITALIHGSNLRS
ncbi:methylmalonyl-CoA mutase, alpha subunit [Oleiphilus messinensis]|uniref:Methylmalonyl-CoA mutase, alpha subunit n=1 Tax=Oleiphilus messinensis TaxID=141451 RepID=A0A1Y0I9U0_9GAMM|nr:protein meaA [Oleiphilus messinensis]ARU56245.1 methylmalonyl-CoA mutase, alpha subunit [Oleiphilus messinensis]